MKIRDRFQDLLQQRKMSWFAEGCRFGNTYSDNSARIFLGEWAPFNNAIKQLASGNPNSHGHQTRSWGGSIGSEKYLQLHNEVDVSSGFEHFLQLDNVRVMDLLKDIHFRLKHILEVS